MTIQIRNVPEDLHRELRHICLEQNISMTRKLIAMIGETVAKERGK